MLIKHFVFGCSNEFMYMIPKAKAIEVKVNKQNYVKLQGSAAKEANDKMKRQPTNGKRYIIICEPDI